MALCVGTILVSLALTLYQASGLLTGGLAGVAFLIHYATGWPLALVFWLLNIPFYWLAARRMGRGLLVKTILCVSMTSALTAVTPAMLTIEHIAPAYSAVASGVLLGMGFLVLFRHRASLGGLGSLVLYLQDRFGWPAGKVQMGFDASIVACAFFVMPASAVGWSVLGVVLLNLILIVNHRKDRYSGL